MSSLRLPVRLLGSVNASSAYPRELLADFANGDLILINTTGGQVKIPNAITVKTSGTGNAITGISANGKTLTLTKGSTFLTSHPTIAKSTDSTDSLSAAFGGKLSIIDSITRDSNGHVTKINTKSVTLPSAPTSVSGAAGSAAEFTVEKEIALTGDVTGSVSSKAGWSIGTTLKSLYTTAPGAVGPTANASPAHGGTITIPQITVDKAGRVTAITARTITLPSAPSNVSGNAGTATKFASAQKVALTGDVTGSASSQAGWSIEAALKSLFDTAPGAVGPADNASPSYGGTITVPQVTVDKAGRVTGIVGRTITLPAAPTSVSGNAGTATKFSAAKDVTLTGDVTGTASSQAGWTVDTTLKELFTTAPGSVGPTANSSPAHGGTITVPQVTVDKTGRVTAITARTITLPSAPTNVSGNAGTATKFSAAKDVTLTGDVTGTASSQAGWTVDTTLKTLFDTAPGAVGPAAAATLAFGGSVNIPQVTVDTKGRVTAIVARAIKLPSAPTTVSGNAGTATKFASAQKITLSGDVSGSASSQAGWSITATLATIADLTAGAYGPADTDTTTPAHGGTINIPQVTVDAKGRVTAISTKTITLPSAPTTISGNAGTATKFASAQKVQLTGDVTGSASSQAGWSIAATLKSLFTTAPGAIGPTANATPSHGGTFTVPQVTVDKTGRVTAITARTITLPSTPTTVSGNAGTATKFASAQKVELTGDVTGSASSQAGWSIAATLKSLFTTAPGAIGPTANSSLGFSGTFTVPQVTVDKTGRVTAITARTLTMPAKPTPSLTVTSSGSGNFVKSISASGSTISYVKGSAASTVTYKVNIGTTWSGSAAPYTQTISVSGMLATDNPIVDVTPDSTYDTAVSQVEAWGNIHRITTAANSITVYANDKTEVAIPIQLKCIRG